MELSRKYKRMTCYLWLEICRQGPEKPIHAEKMPWENMDVILAISVVCEFVNFANLAR